MSENRTKTIGDCSYTVTKMGGIKGSKVLVRLTKISGAGLGAGLKGGGIGAAISKIAESLSEEDMAYLIDTFAPLTIVKLPSGKSPKLSDVFDDHFDCRYLEMVQWLAFALEVNFASFFRGVGEKLAALGAAKETPAQS